MTLEELQKEKKHLNKKLFSHFKGLTLVNKVWQEYSEDTPLGNMLRRRDKVILQIHKRGNGYGTKEIEEAEGIDKASKKNP